MAIAYRGIDDSDGGAVEKVRNAFRSRVRPRNDRSVVCLVHSSAALTLSMRSPSLPHGLTIVVLPSQIALPFLQGSKVRSVALIIGNPALGKPSRFTPP